MADRNSPGASGRSRLLVVALAAIAGLMIWLLWPKQARTPEQEVRALVARCVEAAEKRDIAPIDEALADDFRGPNGTARQEVKQLLLGQFFRNQGGLVIVNPTLEVKVESPSQATFKGQFVMARGKTPELLKEDGLTRYEISGRVEKREPGWVLVQAEWTQ